MGEQCNKIPRTSAVNCVQWSQSLRGIRRCSYHMCWQQEPRQATSLSKSAVWRLQTEHHGKGKRTRRDVWESSGVSEPRRVMGVFCVSGRWLCLAGRNKTWHWSISGLPLSTSTLLPTSVCVRHNFQRYSSLYVAPYLLIQKNLNLINHKPSLELDLPSIMEILIIQECHFLTWWANAKSAAVSPSTKITFPRSSSEKQTWKMAYSWLQ